jgi:hypothetical protein
MTTGQPVPPRRSAGRGGGPATGVPMSSTIRTINDKRGQAAGLLTKKDLGRKSGIRIGKIPWHTGHDYELSKMPVEFLVAGDSHRKWALSQRPVPRNVRFVTSETVTEADMLILHVDQWIFQEIDKLTLFRRFLDADRPKVIINHGCNMVDGCSKEDMQALLGEHLVICNSSTAHTLWELPNSVYIHHGMSAEEWPQSNYGRQNIVVTQPFSRIHAEYRNNDAIIAFEGLTGIKVDWVGRDMKFDTFDKYRAFLSKSSIYFNPSFASPNPRARSEAMLCGLVPVTTNAQGESRYIENGVNGFCSNNLDELFEALVMLKKDPALVMKMGRAARETAQREFGIARFVEEWRGVVKKTIGRDFGDH